MIKNNYYINAIRSMGLQAIINAKQGHPGMTISAAPINYAIYLNEINISQSHPDWINRDRFVLSAGHGSISLYPILHFARLINIEKIQGFRTKIDGLSGHPENDINSFIEASTGPLGQGLSNAVGMAISEVYLRQTYHQLKGIIDHYTYVVVGDGDLQEGISYEAMSLAGKLKLNKLIVLHDSNKQQLESSVDVVNIENLKKRVESMGWKYLSCRNNYIDIRRCIKLAKKSELPVFIEVNTIIGEGLGEYENSFNAHGFALTNNDLDKFNKTFGCNFNDWSFPADIYFHFYKKITKKGEKKYAEWNELLNTYKKQYPEITKKFLDQINNLEIDISKFINLNDLPKNKATRVIGGWIMNKINESKFANKIFVLSPDISKSTNIATNKILFNNDHNSNMLMAGIREFSVMGIENGISLHGGLIPIGSSFLAFLDYLKPALRLASISKISPIMIFTHDSIAVGSDGPTHQPIEQLATLRTIPNINVLRPADEIETYASFKLALSQKDKCPTAIVLTRQNLLSTEKTDIEKTIDMGGYCIIKNNEMPDLCIAASGSELQLAIETANFLDEEFNIKSNIFSVPNLNKFLTLDDLSEKLKNKIGFVTIEASNDPTWYKLAVNSNTKNYCNIDINNFGYSIDGNDNYEYFGFNHIDISNKIINKLWNYNSEFVEKITKLHKEYRKKFQKLWI